MGAASLWSAAPAPALLALAHPGQTGLHWLALLMLDFGAVGCGGLCGTLVGQMAVRSAAAIDNTGIGLGPILFRLIVDRAGSYTPAC